MTNLSPLVLLYSSSQYCQYSLVSSLPDHVSSVVLILISNGFYSSLDLVSLFYLQLVKYYYFDQVSLVIHLILVFSILLVLLMDSTLHGVSPMVKTNVVMMAIMQE